MIACCDELREWPGMEGTTDYSDFADEESGYQKSVKSEKSLQICG
jgi:hypothetical protein